jgi:hypothetical protein
MNAAFIDKMLSQLIGTIGGRWQFLHRRQMKVKVGVIRPIRPTAILGHPISHKSKNLNKINATIKKSCS